MFVINVNHSIASEVTGKEVPGGHPEELYEFKIDGDGDAVEDLTFRFTFGERGAAGNQALEARHIVGIKARDAKELMRFIRSNLKS